MNKSINISLLIMLFFTMFCPYTGAQTNSYSLEQCIKYALEHSTDISRAENNIEGKESSLDQAKAARLPNLSLNISQNLSSSNNYSNTGWDRDSNSSTNLTLSSSITLYDGAKIKNTIQQSQVDFDSAEADIQTEKEILSLNILTAYINVLLAKEQLENSKAQLESTKKQLEYGEARKSAGIISNADYMNIKSQYASDKTALVSAQSKLRINLVSLMQIMNMPLDNSFNIIDPDIYFGLNNIQEPDSDKIYNIALGIRPEIKTAELDYESAKIGIDIAKADKLPTLTLNGSVGTGYTSNLAGVDFDEQFSNKINPSIGLTLTIPLYQRKKVKNQITQATIQADNYQLNLIEIKNNLRKAIEQACTDANIANMTYRASLEQYEAEHETYRMSEEMFSQGLINSVDYLVSKNNLITAESNLTQAKFNAVLQDKIIDYYTGQPITFTRVKS